MMNDDPVTEVIKRLYFYRQDSYIEQVIDEQGSVSYLARKESVTDELIQSHFDHEITIGPFVLGLDSRVNFACLDIDVDKYFLEEFERETKSGKKTKKEKIWEEIINLVVDLYDRLCEIELWPYIFSSGCRGFHIHIYFDKPVPAEKVRRVLKRIVDEVEIPKGLNIEIFPKQDRIPPNGFGSGVKLPFSINLKCGGYCGFIPSGSDFEPKGIEAFLEQLRVAELVPPETLDELFQQLEPEPEKPGPRKVVKLSSDVNELFQMCQWLTDLEDMAASENHIPHEHRWQLAMLMKPFGEQGIQKTHEVIGHCSDYDANRTQQEIDRIFEKYDHPPNCETLECPHRPCEAIKNVNGRSPVDLISGPKERSVIEVQDGAYWVHNKSGHKRISNYTLNHLQTFLVEILGERYPVQYRKIRLDGNGGLGSKEVLVHPKQLISVQNFREMNMNAGKYIFTGNNSDLAAICEMELKDDAKILVYRPARIGYLKEHKIWLFGDCAITTNKLHVCKPDENGVIHCKRVRLQPQSISINSDNTVCDIPHLSLDPPELKREDFALLLRNNLGDYAPWLGLGWITASLFADWFAKKLNFFPILYIAGKTRSGKSTLGEILMSLTSSGYQGPIAYSESTQVSLSRQLTYHSNLPVWIDEYRIERNPRIGDGYLRSVYNRQLATKGLVDPNGIHTIPVLGTLMVSGESIPSDNALRSRCIFIHLSRKRRNDELFAEINEQRSRISYYVFDILRTYEKGIYRLEQEFPTISKALLKIVPENPRMAINYAVALAGFELFCPELAEAERKGFLGWLEEQTKREISRITDDHPLEQFWQDIAILLENRKINDTHYRLEGKGLGMWWAQVVRIWEETYGRRRGFDASTLLAYIEQEE
jgi:hypothetical protein